MASGLLIPTCMRSIESGKLQALWMRWVCSMYSDILCRKLSGSLNTTGIAILDSSCECTWKCHTNEQTAVNFSVDLKSDTDNLTDTGLATRLQPKPVLPRLILISQVYFSFLMQDIPKPFSDQQIKDHRSYMWLLSGVAHFAAQNYHTGSRIQSREIAIFHSAYLE